MWCRRSKGRTRDKVYLTRCTEQAGRIVRGCGKARAQEPMPGMLKLLKATTDRLYIPQESPGVYRIVQALRRRLYVGVDLGKVTIGRPRNRCV